MGFGSADQLVPTIVARAVDGCNLRVFGKRVGHLAVAGFYLRANMVEIERRVSSGPARMKSRGPIRGDENASINQPAMQQHLNYLKSE